ncbi:MAG: MGMT family protein [Candidatus Coatesbacteria bacterium]|nr:MGMT family protein [Candidatus Coatesbacteria bacterium]
MESILSRSPDRPRPHPVVGEVKKHLLGQGIPDYSCAVLDPALGTEFRRRAWAAARTVPFGETRSYKWLAEQSGSPKAFRAAGAAMCHNRFGLIVPCHRIIASDGTLGGFGGKSRDLAFKRVLLDIEIASIQRELRL